MSPQRIPEKESGVQQAITPETEAYLRQTNNAFDPNKAMPDHATLSPSTDRFDESWPSTENTFKHYRLVVLSTSRCNLYFRRFYIHISSALLYFFFSEKGSISAIHANTTGDTSANSEESAISK